MTMTRGNQVLFLILSIYCHIPMAASFVVIASKPLLFTGRTTSTLPATTTAVFLSNQPPPPPEQNDYNDDAFGLVFLCGATVAEDAVFSGLFLVLSAVAAIATKQGRLPASNQVPAAVAGLTLLVLPLLSAALTGLPYSSTMIGSSNPSARWIELALCSASMLYGFVLASAPEKEP
jgi:hypothetical protein